jgi:toxin YoeB
MRKIIFENKGFEHYNFWAIEDRKIFIRLAKLILEISKDPFQGTGKPEPLKNNLHGYWSRRINDEHRLVYKVTEENVIIISCKYHY